VTRSRTHETRASNRIGALPTASKVNATGLVLAAGGMALQIVAGSRLYPSLAGPVVLLVAAAFVTFGPVRWTRWVGLLVPLVLGLGAIVAAAMTGAFIDQLANVGETGIFVGSLAHVVGLNMAVVGGVAMVRSGRTRGGSPER
jgi:hypothetical protein